MHSSFAFGHESFITRSDIKPGDVAPGMLISLLQKGLQYTSLEHHLNEDGSEKECIKPWSLLHPHVCEKPKPLPKARPSPATGAAGTISIEDAMPMGQITKASKKRKKDAANGQPGSTGKRAKDTTGHPPSASVDVVGMVERFLDSEVVTLTGHQSEVISCAWNPKASSGLLASVAGDDTGRIWRLPEALDPEAIIGHELVLSHQHAEDQSKEVTTLDWSPDGQFLVTGCYDGKASVWTLQGELVATLDQFRGPVFALKWSPSGRFIAGAGLDHCAVVWEAAQPEKPFRVYQNHTSPTMDLDWRDDRFLATCTTEKSIYIYDIFANETEPVQVLSGHHQDEINSVKWSPDGSLLASCSDDKTACIWSFSEQEGASKEPIVLRGHEKEIYCLKWCPTGPGSSNPDSPAVLATASFDQTVRLWDPHTGACLHVLRRHTDSVYAIGFSPDGHFLASGSLDESINIWSVDDGQLVRTYDSGRGGIFELAWNPTGDRLATCTSDSTVHQNIIFIPILLFF